VTIERFDNKKVLKESLNWDSSQEIINLLGASEPGEVEIWHRVNSVRRLERAVAVGVARVLEIDVFDRELVVQHDSSERSDFDLFQVINIVTNVTNVTNGPPCLKLDFKEQGAIKPALELLSQVNFKPPAILNADVFLGPGANGEENQLFAKEFILLCQQYCPQGLLSLGWKTEVDQHGKPIDGQIYTRGMCQQALAVIEEMGWKGGVTFPVRACYLRQSWNNLKQLLREKYTLTLWNNEKVDTKLLQWITGNLSLKQYFFDLIDPMTMDPLTKETFNPSIIDTS